MDKTLTLTPDWRISTDSDNYILQNRRIGESGASKDKEIWINWAYSATLEQSFANACEHIIRDKWPDLTEIIKTINDIRQIVVEFKRIDV